jgi:hypothetical protein
VAGTIVDTNILLDIYTQDEVWEERSAAVRIPAMAGYRSDGCRTRIPDDAGPGVTR